MSNDAVREEVYQRLLDAKAPLDLGQIYQQTGVAEERSEVATALNHLVRDELIEQHAEQRSTGAVRVYCLPGHTKVPESDSATESCEDGGRSQKAPIRAQVADALRWGGPECVSAEELARITGLTLTQVRGGLSALSNEGLVVGKRDGVRKLWRLASGEVVEQAREPRTVGDLIKRHASQDARSEDCETSDPESGEAVYCLRSDGVMEIRRGETTLRLSDEETRALVEYLRPWTESRLFDLHTEAAGS